MLLSMYATVSIQHTAYMMHAIDTSMLSNIDIKLHYRENKQEFFPSQHQVIACFRKNVL